MTHPTLDERIAEWERAAKATTLDDEGWDYFKSDMLIVDLIARVRELEAFLGNGGRVALEEREKLRNRLAAAERDRDDYKAAADAEARRVDELHQQSLAAERELELLRGKK